MMANDKQRAAARRNIRKAQAAWKAMTPRQHARAQPEGRRRKKPGTRGGGKYFRVGVRPKNEFVTFRNQDVGEPGHIQRLAGKRNSGSWDTVSWLISKEDARVERGKLIPQTAAAKDLLSKLGSAPVHVQGDIFAAKPRPKIPKRDKPTTAQKRAWRENIKKAQAARHRQSAQA